MNCGSTQFHQVKNGWQCDYCGTLYLDEKKERTSEREKFSFQLLPSKLSKERKKKRVFISLFVLLIFASLLLYLPIKNTQSSMSGNTKITYPPLIPGKIGSSENINMPANWTKELYDSIVVATSHYNEDNEKYFYDGGSSYTELEKIVGKPDTVISFEKEDYGTPPRVIATWEKTTRGDRAGETIDVTYDKKTLMIIDKKLFLTKRITFINNVG